MYIHSAHASEKPLAVTAHRSACGDPSFISIGPQDPYRNGSGIHLSIAEAEALLAALPSAIAQAKAIRDVEARDRDAA